MEFYDTSNPAGAHRGCEAGKLCKLFKAGEACLGRGVATFGGFTYAIQIGVICITMAVALWCFSLVSCGRVPLDGMGNCELSEHRHALLLWLEAWGLLPCCSKLSLIWHSHSERAW